MNASSINIVDVSDGEERVTDNVRLIWTACLFSEKPAATSLAAYVLDLITAFDTLPEAKKFNFFIEILKNSPGSEDIIAMSEQIYSEILMLRKIKGKSRDFLVALMKGEQMLKKNYDLCKSKYMERAEALDIKALLPICTRNIKTHEKPLLVWWLPDVNTPADMQNVVKFFGSSVHDPEFLMLFDASVKNHATFTELDKITPGATEATVLCEPLFSFPEPVKLTSQQMQIVRNDMSATAWKLMEELVNTGREIIKLSFEPDNFSALAALYKEKTALLKERVQKSVDDNPHLNNLKNETTNGRTCRLWMGMAFFHTVYSFYGKLNIIDPSTEAYSKEETAHMVELGKTRLFLFLEIKGDENPVNIL